MQQQNGWFCIGARIDNKNTVTEQFYMLTLREPLLRSCDGLFSDCGHGINLLMKSNLTLYL